MRYFILFVYLQYLFNVNELYEYTSVGGSTVTTDGTSLQHAPTVGVREQHDFVETHPSHVH
jgi:hypothetical protein